MHPLPAIRSCITKESLLDHIEEVKQGLLIFLNEVPDDYLEADAYPEGWTVARNIKHACNLCRYTAIWVRLPRFFLRLTGKPRHPQKEIEKISATNRNISDYGLYKKASSGSDRLRKSLEVCIHSSFDSLSAATSRWQNEDLDNLRGMFLKLSLRLQILFALKHAVHHVGVARARMVAR